MNTRECNFLWRAVRKQSQAQTHNVGSSFTSAAYNSLCPSPSSFGLKNRILRIKESTRETAIKSFVRLQRCDERNARYRAHSITTTVRSAFFPLPAQFSRRASRHFCAHRSKMGIDSERDGIYCHRELRIFCDLTGISIAAALVKPFSQSRPSAACATAVCNVTFIMGLEFR